MDSEVDEFSLKLVKTSKFAFSPTRTDHESYVKCVAVQVATHLYQDEPFTVYEPEVFLFNNYQLVE